MSTATPCAGGGHQPARRVQEGDVNRHAALARCVLQHSNRQHCLDRCSHLCPVQLSDIPAAALAVQRQAHTSTIEHLRAVEDAVHAAAPMVSDASRATAIGGPARDGSAAGAAAPPDGTTATADAQHGAADAGPDSADAGAARAGLSDDELLRLLLGMQMNAFESGVYIELAMLNHSCRPNCTKLTPRDSPCARLPLPARPAFIPGPLVSLPVLLFCSLALLFCCHRGRGGPAATLTLGTSLSPKIVPIVAPQSGPH